MAVGGTPVETKAHFSIPSIIAIAAAISSLFVGAFAGFMLAIIAFVFGIIGVVLSLSPSIRGGAVSIISIMLAGIGIFVAIVRVLSRIL